MASRPLSPHLSIWKWRVHAITSITHRITGNGLAFAGLGAFAWWLAAAATSREAYEMFLVFAGSIFGWILWVGLSWAFFQHLLSGIRHLLMDTGWGYELAIARASATWTWVGAVLLSAAFWVVILFGKGAF